MSWAKSGEMDKKSSGFQNFLAGRQNFIQNPTISYKYYVLLSGSEAGAEPCPFNHVSP